MGEDVKTKIASAWREPGQAVREWKNKTGGKAIGLVLTDVPEELVHAAKAMPVTLLGGDVPFNKADKRMQNFACTYSRSVVELSEGDKYKDIDGIIIPYACDTTRCLDLIFKFGEQYKFTDCLRLPKRNDADGLEKYYLAELKRLAESVSKFTGHAITEDSLRASIRAYNQVRLSLKQIRAAAGRGALPASDYFSAVRAAMSLAPEDSLPLLKQLVDALPRDGGNGKGPGVVVAGKLPEPPGVVDVLAKAGLRILEDHLTVGGRWVEAAADEAGDPWKALVQRQINRLPFAGIWDCRPSRASYLIERYNALSADGVVFLVQKFCEPAELDYPGIRKELEAAGIPMLQLETDFSATSLEVVRTRVEAFAEMLKERK